MTSSDDDSGQRLFGQPLMKVSFGISHGGKSGTVLHSMGELMPGYCRFVKLWGELLGHENSLLVSLTVSYCVTIEIFGNLLEDLPEQLPYSFLITNEKEGNQKLAGAAKKCPSNNGGGAGNRFRHHNHNYLTN